MNFRKNNLDNVRWLILFGIVLLISSSKGCNFAAIFSSNSITVQTPKSKCEIVGVTEIPDGKELEIKVEQRNANVYLIRLKNVSNRKIFFRFEPVSDKLDVVMPYVIGKRNQNGDFITLLRDGYDYAPQLRPVEINQEITFSFYNRRKGEYRLKFMYLVDGNLVRILNDSDCLFKFTDSDREQTSKAVVQVVTPILTINKNLPKKKY